MKRILSAALVAALALGLSACSEETSEAPEEKAQEAKSNLIAAEAKAVAAGLRDSAMAGSKAYTLLESLTTEVGPRLPGTPADARGIAWAEAKFKALGYDKVWVETFTMRGWGRVAAEAEVVSPYPQKLVITSLGGSVSTPVDGIEAEVAHFATLADLIAADAALVEGRIVFISNRMARARDGSGYRPAVVARVNGPSEAAKKGALAIVIRSIGTDNHRVAHTGLTIYQEGVARIAAAALSNPDADVLKRQVDRGQPVTLRLKVLNRDLGTIETANVIGEITGREVPEEVVIIGGHLDSWDLGTGAIDDGAGVAITMAAGALIGELEAAPRRTIRVVAFGAEERGLLGARAYFAAHKAELQNHIIGAESDSGAGRIWALRPGVAEAALPVMREIWQVLEPLGIEFGDNDGSGGPDMIPLQSAGMAALGLRQDSTDYFDLHHTADDTLDKVDAKALDQNVAAYAAFAYLAAEYEGRFDVPKDIEEPIGADQE
jgi:Zn-dependent M28 family amino/carboxypeptidase